MNILICSCRNTVQALSLPLKLGASFWIAITVNGHSIAMGLAPNRDLSGVRGEIRLHPRSRVALSRNSQSCLRRLGGHDISRCSRSTSPSSRVAVLMVVPAMQERGRVKGGACGARRLVSDVDTPVDQKVA
ncbi:hypothetical protein PUNSTDRAFT_119917 [Punctularia strigosozonata HHB-11173 SS5]|uniref:uncharacterized protein n=1 Tax=Punctularia strigosozonata (strain HHB-11173) TaxID=741275 RepID=UPI00044185E6|nr:uncharacterized protein PUNSTDRAFT_119917 [Punctularia strigosozonata HHB-11173 SS5]EIN09413.1 hypothetical protein PUNSTDRAFT_119917 [Punctularia strigosozonata HHB-11173 SS5]